MYTRIDTLCPYTTLFRSFAAVLSDRGRRRVDQPHVLDLELADQRELEPAVEVVDVAAQATGGFAFGDQRLAAPVDGLVARLAVHAAEAFYVAVGDVVYRMGHVHAISRLLRPFRGEAVGAEAGPQEGVIGG